MHQCGGSSLGTMMCRTAAPPPPLSHYSGLTTEQGTLSCVVSCTSSNRIGRHLIATEPEADESDCCLEVIFVRIIRELVFKKLSDFFFLEEKKKLFKR